MDRRGLGCLEGSKPLAEHEVAWCGAVVQIKKKNPIGGTRTSNSGFKSLVSVGKKGGGIGQLVNEALVCSEVGELATVLQILDVQEIEGTRTRPGQDRRGRSAKLEVTRVGGGGGKNRSDYGRRGGGRQKGVRGIKRGGLRKKRVSTKIGPVNGVRKKPQGA